MHSLNAYEMSCSCADCALYLQYYTIYKIVLIFYENLISTQRIFVKKQSPVRLVWVESLRETELHGQLAT